MKKILFILAWALAPAMPLAAQVLSFDIDTDDRPKRISSGKELLEHMHKKYKHGYCQYYTFSQKNTHYRNDSITGHSEWHEAIAFPDKFRINFDRKTGGDFVIFRNDSAYSYLAGKLVKAKYNSNTLLLLLGGMYFRPYNEVVSRLEKEHYHTEAVSVQSWNGADAYVIGALQGDSTSNQFWVDKKTLAVLRIIEKLNEKDIMDMRFETHQKLCGGYTETKVSFRRNGHLEQVEEYYDIKALDILPDSTFRP